MKTTQLRNVLLYLPCLIAKFSWLSLQHSFKVVLPFCIVGKTDFEELFQDWFNRLKFPHTAILIKDTLKTHTNTQKVSGKYSSLHQKHKSLQLIYFTSASFLSTQSPYTCPQFCHGTHWLPLTLPHYCAISNFHVILLEQTDNLWQGIGLILQHSNTHSTRLTHEASRLDSMLLIIGL